MTARAGDGGLIDLHAHTTASDGCLAPDDLVRRAHSAGVGVLAVTDHDTTAGVEPAIAAGRSIGVTVVPGIEITAVAGGRDVHVLGYFVDPLAPALREFLGWQRADRVRRARLMAERLAALGCAIDIDAILADVASNPDRSVARPRIAVELLRAGHVSSLTDAFDRFIGAGRPAYVPRIGASPAQVVGAIRDAGGVAALAHPGLLGRDDLIPELAAGGMAALEVYHPDHDETMRAHYAALASDHGLVATGGSDYHGDVAAAHAVLGSVSVPRDEYIRLCERARVRPR
jgi:hypothetical protein